MDALFAGGFTAGHLSATTRRLTAAPCPWPIIPIVRRIESRAFENKASTGSQEAFDRSSTLWTDRDRFVGHLLENLKFVATGFALIFVSRHSLDLLLVLDWFMLVSLQ